MSEKPTKSRNDENAESGSPRDKKTAEAVPQKISTGFALMALVPILLALLLFLESVTEPTATDVSNKTPSRARSSRMGVDAAAFP